MTFKEKWKNRMYASLRDAKSYIIKSFDENLLQKHVRSHLIQRNVNLAIDDIINFDFFESKKKFSYAAMLSEYCFQVYKDNWYRWSMKPYTYALLSDNKVLIERYSILPVDSHSIFEDPKKGVPTYWNYLLQGLLSDNIAQIENGLKELFDRNISKNKEISISRAHQQCTEGILNVDEALILKGLREFELKRNKSRFVKNDLCEEILSLYPLAYAKIAWLKGMEVDPKSKYILVELLKVKPLEEYTIPYWFLRDYYRAQGIDWRYDPIHPELQDWDNDPENPNRKNGGFFKKAF